MSDLTIIEKGAPTLAGIKTANLFPVKFGQRCQLLQGLREFNRKMSGYGIKMVPLRIEDGRALLYLFRTSSLQEDLKDELARNILQGFGYDVDNLDRCLCTLVRRFRKSDDFPHEIGLFLGYPSEDVHGFISNRGANCKCIGCWKVYGDADKARVCFENFKACTRSYVEQFKNGVSLERLVVAV